MAVYKRLLLALSIISIIFACFAVFGFKSTKELLESEDAVLYYRAFLQNAKSGIVTKYTVGFDSWIDIISAQREKIRFSAAVEDADEVCKLTYRVTNPFVFFYFPSADYYNGSQYYYRHNGKWYSDNSVKLGDYANSHYLGIPPEFINENNITANRVYKTKKGYYIEITAIDSKKNLKYIITGNADSKKMFNSIHITAINTNESLNIGDKHYFIFYSRINKKVEVKQPDDLYSGLFERSGRDKTYRLRGAS